MICTLSGTHYRISEKRGHLLDGVLGTIVHDHWKPYFKMSDVLHALCNAHLLQELKALEEDHEAWAFNMSALLRTISHLSKADMAAHPQALKDLAAIYDEIVREGFTFHNSKYPFAKPARGRQKRHKGHNLLIRFRDFKVPILRGLSDCSVLFTNNLAEQDIRMMKVKQKISGAFRTLQFAQVFCTIHSFISTKRKLNHNLFRSIQLALA